MWGPSQRCPTCSTSGKIVLEVSYYISNCHVWPSSTLLPYSLPLSSFESNACAVASTIGRVPESLLHVTPCINLWLVAIICLTVIHNKHGPRTLKRDLNTTARETN